jgi:hypothetical protein
MRSTRSALIAGLALTALGMSVSGCSSVGRALGATKITPDEFRTVAKAPLVVPPDYALRPPAPGEPRPQELQPESQARLALLGQNAAAGRSQGETLLADKAGAQKADPLIRYVVDDEFGDVAHKDKGFADRVMFWKKDAPTQASAGVAASAVATGGAEASPIDPKAEEAKIKSVTGGQTVVISRGKSSIIKLPGL